MGDHHKLGNISNGTETPELRDAEEPNDNSNH
jgi:hypothetical protein